MPVRGVSRGVVRGATRRLFVEVAALAGAVALALALLIAAPEGDALVAALPADLAVAAAVLLGAAAALGRHRRSRLVALAVVVWVVVPFLLRGAATEVAVLAAGVATLATVALLALAVRATAPRRDRAARAIAVGAAATAGAVLLVGLVAPAATPPSWLVLAVSMLAWSGLGATGLLAAVVGVVHDRSLPRRVGLGFAAVAAAHAVGLLSGAAGATTTPAAGALQVGGLVLLAGSGALELTTTTTRFRRRLADAEAAVAGALRREEELRVSVAAVPGATGDTLQRMLHEHVDGAPVAALLRDLAVAHRSSGLAVEIDVEPDLQVGMDNWALGQVITNLLVNCARHAPGARVVLRARRHDDRAQVVVADDGPGLAAGSGTEVLGRGAHGLATTAEIVGSYGGTFTLSSVDGGCVATVDLPVQRAAA